MSISERLIEFAKAKYGDRHGYKALFAKDLGVSASQMTQYLQGTLLPGNKIQQKLRELGCDVEWLMTGRKMVTVGDKTVAVYPREVVEEAGIISVTEAVNAIAIEQLNIQISELMKYNDQLKTELVQKNEELLDKKKIIALLEDKILSMGTTLGNEALNIPFPKQVLQKIK